VTTTSGILGHQFELVALQTTTEPTYNYQLPLAEALPGGKLYPPSIGSKSYYATNPHPATQQKIEGWKWNNRVWGDDETENTIGYIPVNWDPPFIGTREEDYFQSGIGSGRDIELQEIKLIPASGIQYSSHSSTWAPELFHGYFYDKEAERYLFSDDSEVVYPTFSGVIPGLEGIKRNIVSLLSFPKIGIPILANKFYWDSDVGEYTVYNPWTKVAQFTGDRDDDLVRQDTYNEIQDSIDFSLIDESFQEYVISYSGITYSEGVSSSFPVIIFNQQTSNPRGYPASGLLFSGLEPIGYSDGTIEQTFHTHYSPIDSGMYIYIFTSPAIPDGYMEEEVVASGIDGFGLVGGGPLPLDIIKDGTLSTVVTEWLPRPLGTTLSGYEVAVDYDYGLIVFGDTTNSGLNVPNAGDTVMIGYWDTMRVEYEPEYSVDTVIAHEANLNPIYSKEASRFVCLSVKDEEPTNITLTAELNTLTSNVFGPLDIGNKYASVIATVRNTGGETLEGENVLISVVSEPTRGGFGSFTEASVITNADGQAKAFYNPPRTINNLGTEILAAGLTITNNPSAYPTLGQTTTLRADNILLRSDINSIFLYKILVNDPSVGYLETSLDQDSLSVQLNEYYRTYLVDEEIYGRTGITENGVLNYYPQSQGTTWEALHRALSDLLAPTIFQDNSGQGRKVICAVVDSGALNPHTFGDIAWVPMQPIDVSKIDEDTYDVIYDTTIFNLPVPSGSLAPVPSGEHYGYFLVGPSAVELQASVYSETYHRMIYSNKIEIQLSIPDSMNGLWIIDELNSIHEDELSSVLAGMTASQQKIPLGFRLRSSNLNLAGALGGVTFLDINPEYNANVWDVDEITPLQHEVTVLSII